MTKRRESEWFMEDFKDKEGQKDDDIDYDSLKDPSSFDEKRYIYKSQLKRKY